MLFILHCLHIFSPVMPLIFRKEEMPQTFHIKQHITVCAGHQVVNEYLIHEISSTNHNYQIKYLSRVQVQLSV